MVWNKRIIFEVKSEDRIFVWRFLSDWHSELINQVDLLIDRVEIPCFHDPACAYLWEQ